MVAVMLSALSLLPLAAAAAPLSCGPPTSPVGVVRRGHEIRFQPRIAAINAALAGPRADVLMLGDSITQQWPDATLQGAFPGRRVVNAGVSGDTTGAMLFRLSEQQTLATVDRQRISIGVKGWARQSPKLVVMLIGSNDLRDHRPCAIVDGIMANARRVRGMYPRASVAVVGILPRGQDGTERQADIAAINATAAQRIGRLGPGFTYVDAGAAMRCRPGPPCDVRRPPNYNHLTPDTYRRFATLLRTRLDRLSK